MVDDLRLYKARERGARARALLEDDLLIEIFDGLEEDFTEIWRSSPFEETEKREDAYRMIRALQAVRKRLGGVVDDGNIAAREIEQQDGASENG